MANLFNIPWSQAVYKVFACISVEHSFNNKQICQRTGLSSGTVSDIMAQLIDEGLITPIKDPFKPRKKKKAKMHTVNFEKLGEFVSNQIKENWLIESTEHMELEHELQKAFKSVAKKEKKDKGTRKAIAGGFRDDKERRKKILPVWKEFAKTGIFMELVEYTLYMNVHWLPKRNRFHTLTEIADHVHDSILDLNLPEKFPQHFDKRTKKEYVLLIKTQKLLKGEFAFVPIEKLHEMVEDYFKEPDMKSPFGEKELNEKGEWVKPPAGTYVFQGTQKDIERMVKDGAPLPKGVKNIKEVRKLVKAEKAKMKH